MHIIHRKFCSFFHVIFIANQDALEKNPVAIKVFSFSIFSFSSNINEIIRAVLNALLYFYEKISHEPKALKALKALKSIKAPRQKHKNAKKQMSHYFPLRCF